MFEIKLFCQELIKEHISIVLFENFTLYQTYRDEIISKCLIVYVIIFIKTLDMTVLAIKSVRRLNFIKFWA